jgi:hypothetical protein
LRNRAFAGTGPEHQRPPELKAASRRDGSLSRSAEAPNRTAEANSREELKRLQEIIIRLRHIASQITLEEFDGQDANYERDSALGRELLYLLADNRWSRATSERIEIARSDSFETKVKIDVELNLITHEAFRGRAQPVWLPLVVLPPVRQRSPRLAAWPTVWRRRTLPAVPRLEVPDSLATLTVVDASGRPLPTLSGADVRRRLAAAVTEIILNIAETVGLPGERKEWISSDRDRRLYLSATMYRLLLGEHVPSGLLDALGAQARSRAGRGSHHGPTRLLSVPFGGAWRSRRAADSKPEACLPQKGFSLLTGRAGRAQHDVANLIDQYALILEADTSDHQDAVNRQLARRALKILRALAESTVVVVALELSSTPLALTLALPSRALHLAPVSWGDQVEPGQRHAWLHVLRLLVPTNWNVILPRARLQLDLLLATSEVDREVEVRLPDGVALDPSLSLTARADLDIRVGQPRDVRIPLSHDREARQPPALGQLSTLVRQLVEPQAVSPALFQCLAAVAQVKADAIVQLLRYHRVAPPPGEPAWTSDKFTAATRQFRRDLESLSDALHTITTAVNGELAGAHADLASVWEKKEKLLQVSMRRHTVQATVSPDVVAARAPMIEEESQRTSPAEARMQVHVAVTDSERFSLARFSGSMSGLLILVVLGLFLVERAFRLGHENVSAEVLAFVLTLFSATQASRIERSDRSTLRGLLAQRGNWLVVATVLPTVILAAALGFFSQAWTWAVGFTVACFALQVAIQSLMSLRRTWDLRRGLGQVSRPRRSGRVLYSDVPDHTHAEVLHSTWWRNTTADALTVGREAHAYLMWGHGKSQTLASLLGHPETDADQHDTEGEERQPTNVLALQRSGTPSESVTFVVFRDEPKLLLEDPALRDEIIGVPLNLDRLAPADDFHGRIDIFLGFPKGVWRPVRTHPVTAVLQTAISHWLTVQEVQLPVPPPMASYGDLQWARVRIGLRDEDLPRLRFILAAVEELTEPTRSRISSEETRDQPIIGVRTGADPVPRFLNPRPDHERLKPDSHERDVNLRQLLLASQLDVVGIQSRVEPGRNDNATWRVMAVTPDWQYGVEHRILSGLDAQLRLVGMTYVILYGKAVLLLLGNRANGDHGLREVGPAQLSGYERDSSASNRRALGYLDKWRHGHEIGTSGDYPLLTVRMRTPDRPGATLQVIEALSDVLRERVPGSLSNDEPNVWYAHVEVASGRVAQIYFTVRLTVDPTRQLPFDRPLVMWGPREYFTVQQNTLKKTTRRARDQYAALGLRVDAPQDTVISIELIRMQA